MTDTAIFTGDIVGSRALSTAQLEAVFAGISRAAAEITRWQSTPVPTTRFRGDGWQMALAPHHAFRAAMLVRAAVRACGKICDTRIGIGIGVATFGSDLAKGDGPAFIASGRALDTMARGGLSADPGAPRALRSALPLADSIAQGWTQRQAEIVQALIGLHPPTQTQLGAQLSISQQMVQKHAKAAHLNALLDVCSLFEDTK